MTKILKKFFSLVIVFSMLISLLPGAIVSAAGEVTIENIVCFGDGVSGSADVLNDNFYYTSYDLINTLSGAYLAESNLDKVVKFTQINSGLEFSWDSETDVKRFDLWILSVGGIEDYTLSYYDGEEWKSVKEGTFAKYDTEIIEPSEVAGMNVATRASYYPIVLEEVVKVKKLRFTIDSFYENNQTNVGNSPVAYVSEVKVRSDNNVNLGDLRFYGNTNGGRWNPYLHGFQVGAVTNEGTSSSSTGYSMSEYKGAMWPGYSTSTIVYPTEDYDCSTEDAGIWYISRLWRSKVKINRVGINLYSGSITEFEVWANKKDIMEPWSRTMEIPITDPSWEKLATFRCNITPSTDDVFFDIPNGIEASQYMIRATEYDNSTKYTTRIGGFRLYALADSELSVNLKSLKASAFGAIVTDGYEDSARKEFTLPKTVDGGQLVWSTDSDLVTLEEDTDSYKATVKIHNNEEEITLRADYYHTGGGIYIIEGSFTLLPFVNECNISASGVSFPSGKNEVILNDGVFGSAYDEAVGNEASFMSVTEDSVIEFVWDEKTDLRGFELWTKLGAIEDCTIEYKESDDASYTVLDEEQYTVAFKDAQENQQADAVYCPVIFDEKLNAKCLKMSFTLAEGKNTAELSEALCLIDLVDLAKSPVNAENSYKGYSHYISGYVAGKTSGDREDPMLQKSNSSAWPTANDGEELYIVSENEKAWYAMGFADTKLNVNRVSIPVIGGSAKEIQVLYAENESGFDYASSDPACPDTRASWEIAATVQGNFITGDIVTIDIASGNASRYWMIKVEGTSDDFKMGRVGVNVCTKAELSNVTNALRGIFEAVITDADGDKSSAKSFLKLPKKFNECDVIWSKGEDIDNILTLDSSTDSSYVIGTLKDHDKGRKITLTAAVTAPGSQEIKYCVKKEFNFIGLLTVKTLKMVGETLTEGDVCDILTDDFTYTQYDYAKILGEGAFKHPEKFIHLEKEGEGFEFSYENPKTRRRFEIWAWPLDCISEWKAEYFDEESSEWKECGSGVIRDQYEETPELRPADQASDGTASFYPIIFDKAVTAKRFRFIAVSYRKADPDTGAYISEADLMETNDTNYVMMNSLKLSDATKKKHPKSSLWSKYIGRSYVSFVENNNVSYCLDGSEPTIWPSYSEGPSGRIGITAVTDDYLNEEEGEALPWYYTSFSGGLVAVNGASITIGKGTATEFEVMCAETINGTPAWQRPPQRPDSNKNYRTIARVSGDFKAGDTVKVVFDNEFSSKHYLIKVTKFSDDFVLNDVGLYSYAEEELDKACRVLGNVFDNVTESGIDNVITDKINIPTTLNLTVDSITDSYDVRWIYDSTVINADGTVQPSPNDREMTLTAHIASTDGKYSHIVSKDYVVLGQDNRNKTLIHSEENITVDSVKEIDLSLDYGFKYSQKETLEIILGEAVNSKIILNAENKELLSFVANKGENTITVNDGETETITIDFTEKVKFEVQDGTYAISIWDKDKETPAYVMAYFGRKLKSNSVIKSIKLENNAAQSWTGSGVVLSVPSEVLFEEVERQFNFLSISTERATDLNKAPEVINSVEDIIFSYSSSDPSVISFVKESDGWKTNLDNTQYKSAVITVTALQETTGKRFTKSFTVLTGKDNVFSKGYSTSKAASVDENIASFALDGSIETSFVTNASKYNIVLNLGETVHFNNLRIIPADATSGNITKYSVDISSDGINYTENIYSGTTLNENDIINVGYQSARYVRFNVEGVSQSGTGIKEFCAYNEMSDQEKLDFEFNALIDSLPEIKNGTIIPKSGEIFGTNFTLSVPENSPVSFVETDDKRGFKVVTGKTKVEVTVTMTLLAINGSKSASKNYSMTILASSDIGGNTIGGDSPSLGGGSGGSGGTASATNVPIVTPAQNAPVQSTKLSELEGHWGANEIKSLIADGIVEGDGEKLDLKRSVTRAEFCKMVLAGFDYELEEYKGTFSDVSSDMWFARYAETAAKYGVMSGDMVGFRGNDPISRQEMAVVIVNLLKAQTVEIKSDREVSFTDDTSISQWAKEYVVVAAGLGLLNGYDTGDFKPEKSLQRDEAMVVVYRVISHAFE